MFASERPAPTQTRRWPEGQETPARYDGKPLVRGQFYPISYLIGYYHGNPIPGHMSGLAGNPVHYNEQVQWDGSDPFVTLTDSSRQAAMELRERQMWERAWGEVH
jgi:hypothetical protein